MPSKDQDGLAEIGEGRMFSEEMSRVYTDLMIGKEPLVGAERWEMGEILCYGRSCTSSTSS